MNFSGKVNSTRLKEVRLFRKMTMAELAQKVGINKQAISQFENKKNAPDPITLANIAKALDFPYAFFIETDPPSMIGNTYFRALYSSKKKDLVAQKVKAKYLTKIHSILSSKVIFPNLNLPNFSNNNLSISEIANQTRQYWNLGDLPIDNMVNVLEKNGIIVGEFATESREIDAYYQYYEENDDINYCVILGNDKKSFYRRQFNCAHELGHILLHEKYSDLEEINRDEFRQREKEANSFAASFLMPASSFGAQVAIYPNRLSHYIELKKYWKVSIMSMIMRAFELKIISTNQYSYLIRQMSSRGYRKSEPLDNIIEYKHPNALKNSIELLMTKGGMSGNDVLNLFKNNNFSLSPNVIEELLDLKSGTLSYSSNNNLIKFPI